MCQDRADIGGRGYVYTECGVTILTTYCVHMDDLYLSMICVEHAHYLVAMEDHVQINIWRGNFGSSGPNRQI